VGNPLLDLQVRNGEGLLKKYDLKANNAILAEPQHQPVYDEVAKNPRVNYVAGGASQNAARAAAYILPPKSVVFTGCVGDDAFAEQLKVANQKEGLDDVYLVKKGEKTGACAVIITGHDRSLVTDLRSAEKFEQSHLSSPEVAPLVEAAEFFYIEGYFLTHGTSSVVELSKNASGAGKTFVLNLSAPFIPQFFKAQLDQVLPYTDILIGNKDEAETWATAQGLPTNDLAEIAERVANLPKSNPSRERTVIFTQGAGETIVATSKGATTRHPVPPLQHEIVDSNAAGDAFAGGVLASLVLGQSVPQAIQVGHKMGAMCLAHDGAQFTWPKVNVLQ